MSRAHHVALRLCIASALLQPVVTTAAGQLGPRAVEVSGLPALNFDADEGFGYGAIVALYGHAPGAAGYSWTFQPTVFLTTHGRRDYTLFFDAPSSATNPWRTTAYVGHEQQLSTPWYGVGNATPYDSSIEHGSRRYYYRYGRLQNRASLDLQHRAGSPSLRLLGGLGFSNDDIDLTPFDSGTTLIQAQLHDVTPARAHTNYLRVGLTWDTRDREIGTRSGTWADLLAQRVDTRLGATTDYTRWTGTLRHYQPFGARLTLANRLLVQTVEGDAPFSVLSEVQTTQKPQDGLGGASTVRGLPKDRFVGKGLLVSNNELRWRAADFALRGRPSSLVLSGFVDTGRVWADGVDLSTVTSGLHSGYGAGARLGFGSSFVIATDVGHSSQSSAPIYIGLGYLF
jgi:outer membrane protein assembly factor BamA